MSENEIKNRPASSEVSQVTLSTIGDLSMAATSSADPHTREGRVQRWAAILVFLVVVYFAICLATLLSFKRDPLVRAFLIPLFPALIATAVFWWRQHWKLRAKRAALKSKTLKNAFGSLSHEVTCATNAIQANLKGFRLANQQVCESEYLQAIDTATARIGKALQKSAEPAN